MKAKVRDMLNFHSPNTSTLFDHVPQELLPNEYGGKAGSMCDIKRSFVQQVEKNRDYLSDESYWKPRDSNKNSTQVESNLKFLSID